MIVESIGISVKNKIERFREDRPLRVLDLFAGCGGLSLGFHKMGYEIIGAVELDKEAARSHAMNFHPNDAFFSQHACSRDIQKVGPAELLQDIGITEDSSSAIDVIIGGPPCQAFTRVGRAKLRNINKEADAFLKDPRSQLYKRYLEYVRELAPMAILMENVPDMLNYGNVNIADLICQDLVSYGYKCQYTLLNSVFYGIPQMRERMFLIALHGSIQADIKFPLPSHYIELPQGYHGSRSVALKHMKPGEEHPHYIASPAAKESLKPAVTAMEALSDLPEITSHLKKKLKRGIKPLTEEIAYRKKAESSYQRVIRAWAGFKARNTVTGNVIRLLPRDYPIFRKMKAGQQYPEAIQVAMRLLRTKLMKEMRAGGKALRKNSKRYKQLVKQTVPPYDVGKFPNKWRKMEPDMPARTLMAHLGKDSYSHIHYDSSQARTISVREAARLQSFPDGFRFAGAMNSAFRQIGNAVPPLMAAKLAKAIQGMIQTGTLCQVNLEARP